MITGQFAHRVQLYSRDDRRTFVPALATFRGAVETDLVGIR